MIRYTIDPDAKVAKPNESAAQAKAGPISEENRKTEAKADKPVDGTPAKKAGPIAAENKKTAPKSRKAPAKRATSNEDDERLL